MSAKYLLPYCVVPTYLLDTLQEAENCGLMNGFFYAFMVSIVIIFFGIRSYLKSDSASGQEQILVTTGIILILVWLFLPLVFKHGFSIMWIGYTNLINSLLALGYTRYQAITILENSNVSSDVTIGGISTAEGALIAGDARKKLPIGNGMPQCGSSPSGH